MKDTFVMLASIAVVALVLFAMFGMMFHKAFEPVNCALSSSNVSTCTNK